MLFGIVILLLSFLIHQIESDNFVLSLFNLVLWPVAWAAIVIGMAKIGKREDWRSGLRERARENALLAAAASASTRTYIIAGIALYLLLILVAVFLADRIPEDNLVVEAFAYLMLLVPWAAIAIGIVRIGHRKGWWSGLSERADPVGSIDMRNSRLSGSPMGSFVIGIVLILLGLVVRSMAFVEFLYDTKFLFELLVEVDQGLWPLYEPLYSAMGTNLHNISPTLGVLSWLGILAGMAMIVIAVVRMRARNDTPNQSG